MGKVTPQTVSLQILKEGYVDSYVDFFYITNNCMHDFLTGGSQRFEVNSREDHQFDVSQENLEHLKDCLIRAEESARYPEKQ